MKKINGQMWMIVKMVIASFFLFFAESSDAIAQVKYIKNIDKFDGFDASFVSTSTKRGEGEVATLAWRCFKDGLGVVLVTENIWMGSRGYVNVIFKFDDNAPTKEVPAMIVRGQPDTVVIKPDFALNLAKLSVPASGVTLRVLDPRRGSKSDYSFSLSGFTKNINKLSCFKG